MFENPHGQDDLTQDEKAQLKLLYSVSVILTIINIGFFRAKNMQFVRLYSHRGRPQLTSISVMYHRCSIYL
jgi:hypothetical protein